MKDALERKLHKLVCAGQLDLKTEGTHSGGWIGSEFEKAALAQTPLGRIGQPSDIASFAVFWPRKTPPGLPASDFLLAAVFANPQTAVGARCLKLRFALEAFSY